MMWHPARTGFWTIQQWLPVLRMLQIPFQLQNDDKLLLTTDAGLTIMAHIEDVGRFRGFTGPERVARAYQADPTTFHNMVGALHAVVALGPEITLDELNQIVNDILKLGS